jgi:hypothetical protein
MLMGDVNSRIGEKHENLQDAWGLYSDGDKAEFHSHGLGANEDEESVYFSLPS